MFTQLFTPKIGCRKREAISDRADFYWDCSLFMVKKMACKVNGCNQKLYKIKSTKSIFYTLYYAFYCWASA